MSMKLSGLKFRDPFVDFMLDSSRRQQFFFLFSRAALLALDKDSPECPRIILTGSLVSCLPFPPLIYVLNTNPLHSWN
jgi:hypothetical protein